ncbi:MAG: NAD(P)-dependent oxidoreductase [Candidatus Rokuibacteriota bacterium]|nr:MAG: NAD(P)-dependent oxidoreductase [Candidatus Rokubacteria bacterium]
MAALGFVGLGAMGSGMARRLLAAGHELHGYNRTEEKARQLVGHGLILELSPRAAAAAADIVLTMVTNVAAIRAIAEGPDGILAGLRPGAVWVDMSTVAPAVSRELAEEARAVGADMVDAPVSGSISTLEEGRLSIMVGGLEGTYERVRPVLLDIGPTVHRVGENGQAVLLKIAINLSLFVQMTAFSEGLLLAEKHGVDRERAVEVMLSSVIASPMIKYRGPFVLDMPDEAWFDVDMMQKDMLLALEAGREAGVPLPTTAACNELLTAARAMGLAHHDFAIVYEVLARMAGRKEVGV